MRDDDLVLLLQQDQVPVSGSGLNKLSVDSIIRKYIKSDLWVNKDREREIVELLMVTIVTSEMQG